MPPLSPEMRSIVSEEETTVRNEEGPGWSGKPGQGEVAANKPVSTYIPV